MTTISDYLKLFQALNSRLSHEVAGLVGSISSTTELTYSKNKEIEAQAKNVLTDISKQLTNIMTFYRFAYGFCYQPSFTTLSEMRSLCEGMVDYKISFSFTGDDHEEVDSELAKAILCLVITSIRSIIKTGSLSISYVKNSGGNVFKIHASSQHLKKEPGKIAILLGELEQPLLDVDNSHEFYTYHLVKTIGASISVEQESDSISYSVSSI
jgi:hypothetical protein